jgi:hypothetical protein
VLRSPIFRRCPDLSSSKCSVFEMIIAAFTGELGGEKRWIVAVVVVVAAVASIDIEDASESHSVSGAGGEGLDRGSAVGHEVVKGGREFGAYLVSLKANRFMKYVCFIREMSGSSQERGT